MSIKTPFATLKDTFADVPAHIGFNIEVKYPNNKEADEESFTPTDLNRFVDEIL